MSYSEKQAAGWHLPTTGLPHVQAMDWTDKKDLRRASRHVSVCGVRLSWRVESAGPHCTNSGQTNTSNPCLPWWLSPRPAHESYVTTRRDATPIFVGEGGMIHIFTITAALCVGFWIGVLVQLRQQEDQPMD